MGLITDPPIRKVGNRHWRIYTFLTPEEYITPIFEEMTKYELQFTTNKFSNKINGQGRDLYFPDDGEEARFMFMMSDRITL